MSIADLVDLDDRLIAALERGRVIVPSERLRDAIDAALDRECARSGRRAWRAPDVATLDQHLALHFEAAVRSGTLEDARLLGPEEERAVWRSLARDGARAPPQASMPAAWRLLHEHALGAALETAFTVRQREFAVACRAFERAAASDRFVTVAELPALLTRVAANLDVASVTTYGFDRFAPAHARYFAMLGDRVTRLAAHAREPAVALSAHDDPDREFAAAVAWAREALLSDATACVGILLRDAAERHSTRVRALDAALRPHLAIPDLESAPYAISGGVSLADTTFVAAALDLLRWIDAPLPRAQVAALLSSPLLRRRDADDGIRRAPSQRGSLPEHSTLRDCADLSGDPFVRALAELAGRWPRAMPLPAWRRAALDLLDVAVSPHARAWRTASDARAMFVRALDALVASHAADPVPLAEFLRVLDAACRDATFARAWSRNARLHVLGYDETAGLRFTHLWVTGVDDRSFPSRPTLNAWLRADAQRAADVPRSSTESELRRCRDALARWRASACVVRFSYAREHDDDVRGPSPLVASWPESTDPSAHARHPFRVRRNAVLEARHDAPVPLATPHVAPRGAQVLIDQQSCPFKSFARNRLDLAPDRPPHDFPDALDRGELVHRALEALALPRALAGDRLVHDGPAIERAVSAAIASWRRFPAPVVALERRLLVALLTRYVAHDRERAAHAIEAVEADVSAALSGLELALRVDRIDRTPAGRIVIDYKTGRRRIGAPDDDPQLPLYASTLPGVVGVARVDLRPDGCRTTAIAERADLVTGAPSRDVRVATSDWPAQLARWRADTEDLALAFVAGDARVAPESRNACRGCGLDPLCRIGRRSDGG